MIFRILLVDLEKIIYRFSFYKEIEEVLEYGFEFNTVVETKSIDYLFSVLQVTKNLAPELREYILNRYIISEFREEYFIVTFEQTFIRDLDLLLELETIENTYFEDIFPDHISLDSWYYNSD